MKPFFYVLDEANSQVVVKDKNNVFIKNVGLNDLDDMAKFGLACDIIGKNRFLPPERAGWRLGEHEFNTMVHLTDLHFDMYVAACRRRILTLRDKLVKCKTKEESTVQLGIIKGLTDSLKALREDKNWQVARAEQLVNRSWRDFATDTGLDKQIVPKTLAGSRSSRK